MADHDFTLPDLGEGVHEGQVVRVHVREGERVREDQPLMEVETDKAAVEIPCPFTGVVRSVHVGEGQLVNVGDVMVTFGDAGDAADAPMADAKATGAARASETVAAATAPAASAPAPGASAPAPATPRRRDRPTPASPAVRKLARSLGLDLDAVPGSGPGGRVSRADVERAAAGQRSPAAPAPSARRPAATAPAAASPPPMPEVAEPPGADGTDAHGPVRRQPMSQARRTIARVMAESWATIPHVTDTHDADVTDLDRLRRGHAAHGDGGPKLTLLPFVVRAVVRALRRFPEFNASFDAEAGEIVYRRYVNVAIGVHTERGLIAPVIRDADRLGVMEIAAALDEIAEKARSATFAVDETRGGTYTISNPGALGSTRYSTPIITPPQVAVLALGRTRRRPWIVDDAVVPRLVMPLSHSFDHRAIDGGQEVAFMQHLVADLEQPARLVL